MKSQLEFVKALFDRIYDDCMALVTKNAFGRLVDALNGATAPEKADILHRLALLKQELEHLEQLLEKQS